MSGIRKSLDGNSVTKGKEGEFLPQKYTRVVVSNRAHDSKQVVPRSKIILPLPAGISREKKIPSVIKFVAKLSVDNL